MWREVGRWRALASLGFVLAVLALAGFGITQVARRQWRTQKTFHVRADFPTIGGVGAGQRVRIQGVDAGVVESIVPPTVPGKPVRLVFRIDEKLRPLVQQLRPWRDDRPARRSELIPSAPSTATVCTCM